MSTVAETIAGRYQIQVRLGSGGMGEVFRAHDPVLNRSVALKILPREFAKQQGFIARFKREAQSAARVNHPSVVAIYDWGEDNGTYYMVMEYVRGKNLRQVLSERGRLAPKQACDVIAQVLGALGAAHEQGLVHRDIKPENVLVSSEGEIKVTDFGIAKPARGALTSSMLGSVAYAAPEQARGEAVGPATDLYSAGCLFFELLTGWMPFEGDAAYVLNKHLTERVPRPSDVYPDVGPNTDHIVRTATEPDISSRYLSALDMRIDVIAATSGLPPAPPIKELTGEITTQVSAEIVDTTVIAPAPRRKKGWWKWGLVVVGLIAIVVAAFALSPVKVPEVGGDAEKQGEASLKEAGFRVSVVREFSDKTQGAVVRTDPPAGRRARRGSMVTMIVSKGPDLTDVPDLTGRAVPDARLLLGIADLNLGTETSQSSRTVPAGLIIDQDPKPGRARRGDPVNVTVSSGPLISGVPDTLTKPQAEAETILATAGFVVKVETAFNDAAEGTVYDQSPKPGTQAKEGSEVRIFVSKGLQPFDMPDVKNKKCSEAKTTLEGLGLVVTVKDVDGNAIGCGDNLVLDQDPLPRTKVRKGQPVIVYTARV